MFIRMGITNMWYYGLRDDAIWRLNNHDIGYIIWYGTLEICKTWVQGAASGRTGLRLTIASLISRARDTTSFDTPGSDDFEIVDAVLVQYKIWKRI
jgi:hypothetical protein